MAENVRIPTDITRLAGLVDSGLKKGPEKTKLPTPEEKIDTIQRRMAISYDLLAEMLPSKQNGELDLDNLNFVYWITDSLTDATLESSISLAVRQPISNFKGDTVIDLILKGQAEEFYQTLYAPDEY